MFKLILLIITFPIWFPVIVAFCAVLFAFAIVVSLTGFAITAAAAALSLAGIMAIVLFILSFANSAASGLMGIGGGCILLGLGLMIGTAGINLCIRLFPWLISLIKRVFTKPFHRKARVYTRDVQVARNNMSNNYGENYPEERQ